MLIAYLNKQTEEFAYTSNMITECNMTSGLVMYLKETDTSRLNL